jgi:pyruvate,orthophosphate dikinase
MTKWVYPFTEGSGSMRDLLGGKGAGVAEMTQAKLPVPPGFTITTEACNTYNALGERFPDGMWDQVLEALRGIEAQTGKGFGDTRNPLLVSVRSGAKFSMPGMMDTVLNLGLNEASLQGLIQHTQDERFAFDAYRRFLQMYSKIVLGLDPHAFEVHLEEKKQQTGARTDADLSVAALKELVETFKGIVLRETGQPFPTAVYDQLKLAIQAVFNSWMNKRAVDYREYHKIPHDLGTAVNVQTMVFGNMGWDSGTGVAFTRNPLTGERVLYGEFLQNAQGEDVVAGIRTPTPIAKLNDEMPEVYRDLIHYAGMLEHHYRDMQDLEFTIEHGKLFMLQTRSGKRSPEASVRVAVEMVREQLISKAEALQRVEPLQIEQLLHRRIDPAAQVTAIAKGLNAAPGAATGKVVFDADRAELLARRGEPLILVRPETNPDDVHGIIAAQGTLTARGGATSHAAVVARGLGKPCVAGCESITIDLEQELFTVDGVTVRAGEVITINGSTGEVMLGEVPLIEPELSEDLKLLLSWADEVRLLEVWANADYPRDALKAREYGAEGIGLCRTEHMFFEPERLSTVRTMILVGAQANVQGGRRPATDNPTTDAAYRTYLDAIAELEQFQKQDFVGIFRAMAGFPVVIRLLDPPLHEFLPRWDELLEEVLELRHRGPSAELAEKEVLLREVSALREANPMLGLRGCRLGILYPEIYEMQVRALFHAAIQVAAEGHVVKPEIMIPLVSHSNELRSLRDRLEQVARVTQAEAGVGVAYKFGTMIEVPRAALTAGQIAQSAEFFSFGTNDLTQTTFGISRDDAEGKFLLQYVDWKLLPENPFQVLDRDGVGQLIRMAKAEGRRTQPDLELGICGEHGGDPASIALCHEIGLNYVSCSPFRVPVARLAAAQAALSQAAVSSTA